MKLYYAPGTCSLGPRIVAYEMDIDLDSQRVDIKNHQTEAGSDYLQINPKGYVPALELDNGTLLTEGIAIMQYLALLREEQNLIAPLTSFDFFKQEEWLTFISSELHKTFSPWLFHPEYGSDAQRVATQKIYERFNYIDAHLAGSNYLVSEQFSLCDIYLFTIARWSSLFDIDLVPYPKLSAYLERVAKRPAVQAAIKAEGLGIDKSSTRTWSGQDASDLMG